MKKTRNFLLKLFISLLVISCSSGSAKNAKETKQGDWTSGEKTEKTSDNLNATNATGSTTTTVSANAITIQKAGGVFGIINDKGPFSFTFAGHDYTSKLNGDKRKYEGNKEIVEVKYKDDGFKVRTADGKLLWKVKITDDKIKISDNEESKNPWEIKISESGKAKVKKEDKDIGKVKLNQSKKEIEASEFVIKADKLSLAYGVLLINEIPERDKFIIMTELIAKDK